MSVINERSAVNRATSVHGWLERAATWRFTSLVFQSPSAESLAELRGLGAEIAPACRATAARLCDLSLDDWQVEYHRVLGPGGIPACETSYDDNALAGRGPLLSRVAAFYEAFAYRPDEASREVPDHISVETGFLGYLALKAAYALESAQGDALAVATDAYDRFEREHLLWWIDRFEERVARSESAIYSDAIALVLGLCPAHGPQDDRNVSSAQKRTTSSA
jgi:TorA maturation chaperone TorD